MNVKEQWQKEEAKQQWKKMKHLPVITCKNRRPKRKRKWMLENSDKKKRQNNNEKKMKYLPVKT